MSRIDTRSEPFISAKPVAQTKSVQKTKAADAPGVVNGLRGLKNRVSEGLRVRSKRIKRLTAVAEITESDLEPLTGKKRDDLIGELSRIMAKIQEIEELLGSDDTSMLCKVMIREQVRRLMLVEDGQSDSSDLKGTA